MMFHRANEKTYLFIFLLSLLYFSVFTKISKEKLDGFVKEKVKIEKALNQQKLSNYLTKLMMKNDNIIDKDMYFLDNEDFQFGNEDINYSSMQLRDDDNEFKARVFALKWGLANEKKKELRPYHVKDGDEKIENWKTFLVLMMGKDEDYVLKKVCFPDRQGENFAIVTEFSKNCKDKIHKIHDYKVFESENNLNNSILKGLSNEKMKDDVTANTISDEKTKDELTNTISDEKKKDETNSSILDEKKKDVVKTELTSEKKNQVLSETDILNKNEAPFADKEKLVSKEKNNEKVKKDNQRIIEKLENIENKGSAEAIEKLYNNEQSTLNKNNNESTKEKSAKKIFSNLNKENKNLLKKIEKSENNENKTKKESVDIEIFSNLKKENLKLLKKIEAIEEKVKIKNVKQNFDERDLSKLKEENFKIIQKIEAIENDHQVLVNSVPKNIKQQKFAEIKKGKKINKELIKNLFFTGDLKDVLNKNNKINSKGSESKIDDMSVTRKHKIKSLVNNENPQELKSKKIIQIIKDIKNSNTNSFDKIQKIHMENKIILKKINKFINMEKKNVMVAKKPEKEKVDQEIEKLFDDDEDYNAKKTQSPLNFKKESSKLFKDPKPRKMLKTPSFENDANKASHFGQGNENINTNVINTYPYYHHSNNNNFNRDNNNYKKYDFNVNNINNSENNNNNRANHIFNKIYPRNNFQNENNDNRVNANFDQNLSNNNKRTNYYKAKQNFDPNNYNILSDNDQAIPNFDQNLSNNFSPINNRNNNRADQHSQHDFNNYNPNNFRNNNYDLNNNNILNNYPNNNKADQLSQHEWNKIRNYQNHNKANLISRRQVINNYNLKYDNTNNQNLANDNSNRDSFVSNNPNYIRNDYLNHRDNIIDPRYQSNNLRPVNAPFLGSQSIKYDSNHNNQFKRDSIQNTLSDSEQDEEHDKKSSFNFEDHGNAENRPSREIGFNYNQNNNSTNSITSKDNLDVFDEQLNNDKLEKDESLHNKLEEENEQRQLVKNKKDSPSQILGKNQFSIKQEKILKEER